MGGRGERGGGGLGRMITICDDNNAREITTHHVPYHIPLAMSLLLQGHHKCDMANNLD